MRLYKRISPAILIAIIFGIIINTSSLDTSNFGDNNTIRYGVTTTGDLKKTIDSKYRIANTSLAQINTEFSKIVKIASKQVGDIGGNKYWSWYGFNQKVAWCACFVSWCAGQCGFIDRGIIPKFAAVKYGQSWFTSRGLWLPGYKTPQAGMIIFFDFVNSDLQDGHDGLGDHVGIVTSVKDGYVYCVEGNYNDMVASTKYVIGNSNILGYGTPEY